MKWKAIPTSKVREVFGMHDVILPAKESAGSRDRDPSYNTGFLRIPAHFR